MTEPAARLDEDPGLHRVSRLRGALWRAWDSDILYSFRHSPVTIVAAVVALVLVGTALAAPLISPTNPFALETLDLMAAFTPPAWTPDGVSEFLLGTDDQGRDMLSAILYGMRISLFVGAASVVFAMVLGVGLGLLAGYAGGWVDALIMRVADVQLSFPAILIALLVDGVARGILPREVHHDTAIWVIIFAIGVSGWVQYARTVRGSTMVEKNREYVMAAHIMGVHPVLIAVRHVLPNVLGPVLVIATIHLAIAVITEATLSFLGVGLPPTEPSLGTLIRIGNDFLFSGEWWITVFPGIALVLLVLSVNLLGDWLRDALNPKLR
ncbi:ABC transporter permease [Roseospira marina]|uniref:ABC transporter permease n=1 Tax=Roseospira marina TaxID=140057 RepID=A0A5M6ICZ0_9PROT|nr:ABC transporter permease [Roseospira marina]KAA5605629.1 ABC transporter permease [Roseospira marina]MBB4313299.1 peptide/nickel transport system permease protein [Roseospira marina]MBB5085960.1 peptide/nickel transport system permease protein [Roseospira marina]